jgi:hypothetical protein
VEEGAKFECADSAVACKIAGVMYAASRFPRMSNIVITILSLEFNRSLIADTVFVAN